MPQFRSTLWLTWLSLNDYIIIGGPFSESTTIPIIDNLRALKVPPPVLHPPLHTPADRFRQSAMCLIIWVNQERFTREGMRAKEYYRHRYPCLMNWLFGPQTLPPQYNTPLPQHNQIKLVTQRPDSLTLPKYIGLCKHAAAQMLKKVNGSPERDGKSTGGHKTGQEIEK